MIQVRFTDDKVVVFEFATYAEYRAAFPNGIEDDMTFEMVMVDAD